LSTVTDYFDEKPEGFGRWEKLEPGPFNFVSELFRRLELFDSAPFALLSFAPRRRTLPAVFFEFWRMYACWCLAVESDFVRLRGWERWFVGKQ
jgi:hypothetical protein